MRAQRAFTVAPAPSTRVGRGIDGPGTGTVTQTPVADVRDRKRFEQVVRGAFATGARPWRTRSRSRSISHAKRIAAAIASLALSPDIRG